MDISDYNCYRERDKKEFAIYEKAINPLWYYFLEFWFIFTIIIIILLIIFFYFYILPIIKILSPYYEDLLNFLKNNYSQINNLLNGSIV